MTNFSTHTSPAKSGRARSLFHLPTFLLTLFLLLVILLPRLLALDHFINLDEPSWLIRSGNFYYALAQGDFENTFQREHPGVTLMWAGTAAFLWHYAAYVDEVPGYLEWDREDIQPFLRAHGHEPLELLIAARIFMVVMNSAALMLAFVMTVRLFGQHDNDKEGSYNDLTGFLPPLPVLGEGGRGGEGLLLALAGFLLIALDPFHIALSRMLHLDGLMASFMLLSLLAFLSHERQGGLINLLLSSIAAGLAWLTKSPAFFLIPFIALLLCGQLCHWGRRCPSRLEIWGAVKLFLAWNLIALLTYLLLWPALWVNPFGMIENVVQKALVYAAEGHHNQLYFNRTIYEGNPSYLFYSISFLWRTTPIVLLGLLFALIAFISKQPPFEQAERPRITAILILFAFLFMLLLEIGSKKFDRYLMPSILPLDLVAALGWAAAAQAMQKYLGSFKGIGRVAPIGLLVVALMGQAYLALALYPHFISYYNPLLGGGEQAPQTMQVGWGEGLEEAARYINRKPDADQLRVASWYHFGSVSFFADFEAKKLESLKDFGTWFETDYIMLYIQQQQRQLPNTTFLVYFARQTPEHVIQINGIEYASIYKVREILPPDWIAPGESRFTDWNEAIRLVGYELPTEPLAPNESFQVLFHLENMAPLAQDVHVLVRIVGQDGKELQRDEGWPWGMPTSKWEHYEIWPDGHDLTIPADAAAGYYQVRLSFYDPTTLQPLPATDPYTGEPRDDELLVDYLYIGQLPTPPTTSQPTLLGTDIYLLGTEVRGLECRGDSCSRPKDANQPLELTLFWQTEAPLEQDLTIFVHLVGSDGQLVAQKDQPPLGGFLPTSLWRTRELIVAPLPLDIPADTPSGEYELRLGMYDPITGQRLPVSQNGEIIGDYVSVGSVIVK